MNSPLHILCMKFETKTVFLENQNICVFFYKRLIWQKVSETSVCCVDDQYQDREY